MFEGSGFLSGRAILEPGLGRKGWCARGGVGALGEEMLSGAVLVRS